MSERNFCEKCGGKLSPGARFCEGCGHPVGGAGVTPPDPSLTATPSSAAVGAPCPSCGREGEPAARAIPRLQTAYEAAKDDGSEAYRRLENAVLSLVEPEEPKVFSLGGWLVLLVIPGVNVLSIFFSPVKGALKVVVSMVALVFVGFIVWSVTGTFEDPFAARDMTMAVGAVTFLLYLVVLVYTWFAARREVEEASKPGHGRVLERWKHLRFCEPCQAVFFDDEPGRSAPVEDARIFVSG